MAFYSAGHGKYSQTVVLPFVHIQVPEPFVHDTVFFIVDPKASTEIVWSKDEEGHVTAPKSGIIRVRSLGPLEHHHSRARLSDGRQDWGLLVFFGSGVPPLAGSFGGPIDDKVFHALKLP